MFAFCADKLDKDEQRLVTYIQRTILNLTVMCSSEIDLISEDTFIDEETLRVMIPDLVRRGYLKCAGDSFGVVCWIVTPEVSLPEGCYWCEPFGFEKL